MQLMPSSWQQITSEVLISLFILQLEVFVETMYTFFHLDPNLRLSMVLWLRYV